MTEFNNIGSNKIDKVQNLNFEGTQPTANYAPNYSQKEITNLDNAHSALVGRSMVKKMQKTETPKFNSELVDSVKESLTSFKGNERIVALSDKVFDAAIKKGYSYEQATKMQQEAVEHFKG